MSQEGNEYNPFWLTNVGVFLALNTFEVFDFESNWSLDLKAIPG
jgi:hypothetical protein